MNLFRRDKPDEEPREKEAEEGDVGQATTRTQKEESQAEGRRERLASENIGTAQVDEADAMEASAKVGDVAEFWWE